MYQSSDVVSLLIIFEVVFEHMSINDKEILCTVHRVLRYRDSVRNTTEENSLSSH